MVGDQSDMLGRLKMVLPSRWFANQAPVLDGLLNGLASTAAWAFNLLAVVRQQTRIATASGVMLDISAQDFFGARVSRFPGQTDVALRVVILREMFRPRATRSALIAELTDLTGRPPDLFEPARPSDTNAWGGAMGYGMAGRWGSLRLPNQVFVTAYRASTAPAGGAGPTDPEIYAAAASILPASCVAWMNISN